MGARPLSTNLLIAAIYTFINTLFVWKYAPEYVSGHWLVPAGYAPLLFLAILAVCRAPAGMAPTANTRRAYITIVALLTVALFLLMRQFDPSQIEVGRYPAYEVWITRLFHGEFPYASSLNPTSFPFLFLIMIPFYILGDLGLFQIVAFAGFAFAVYRLNRGDPLDPLKRLLLLVTAPVFLYEVVTRSEIFSNMVMLILFLILLEARHRRAGRMGMIGLGILAGLVMSTRAPVGLVYVIFFGYLILRQQMKYGVVLAAAVLTFLATVIPFLLWDQAYFLQYGPFAKQAAHLPTVFLIAALAGSVLLGLWARSTREAYFGAAVVLFGIVLIAFLRSVGEYGLMASVFGDQFDISYFSFAPPFLLLALDLKRRPPVPA